MILIPGLASSGEVWTGVIEHYKPNHQIHTLTLAGFAGQPAVPLSTAQGSRLAMVRDDLINYIRSNRLQRPVIVGHSLGGFLGFWVAATAPELVGGVIAVGGVPFLPALLYPQGHKHRGRGGGAANPEHVCFHEGAADGGHGPHLAGEDDHRCKGR